jgi:uncharacterized repeat protein (TIGR02543 family)
MSAQAMTYGKAARLSKNAFKRTGYKFAGWAKTATGAVAYQNAAAVKNLRTDGMVTTLYAKWKPTTYQITFDANGGSGTMEGLRVKYDATAALPANAFTRTGYRFAGWAATKAGPVAYKDKAAVRNLRADGGTVTLCAKWSPTTYGIAFDANGGNGTMAVQYIKYGTTANLSANAFRRPGCVFAGWAKTKTGAVAYKDRGAVRNLRADGGTMTLYARWKVATYKIAFDANGGEGEMAPQSVKYGVTANLRSNAFTRMGYAFAGWAKTKTGGIAYTNAATVRNLRTDDGTTTLYARWTVTTYTIAFDANGGEGTMSPQKVQYDETATLSPNVFTRDGYGFLGWRESPSGYAEYFDSDVVLNLVPDGGTLTLYAVWTKLPPIPKSAGKGAKTVKTSRPGAGDAGTDRVLVTASGGANADAVADGDGTTVWTTDASHGAWLVLTFPEAQAVEDVEVVGENLPGGTRFLLSEDADDWREDLPGTAQYLWVVFPACEKPLTVKEIRVLPE